MPSDLFVCQGWGSWQVRARNRAGSTESPAEIGGTLPASLERGCSAARYLHGGGQKRTVPPAAAKARAFALSKLGPGMPYKGPDCSARPRGSFRRLWGDREEGTQLEPAWSTPT